MTECVLVTASGDHRVSMPRVPCKDEIVRVGEHGHVVRAVRWENEGERIDLGEWETKLEDDDMSPTRMVEYVPYVYLLG